MTALVEITAGIDVALGDLRRDMKRLGDHVDKLAATPVFFSTTKTLVTPNANTVPQVVNLGRPMQGKIWEVHNLAIAGVAVDSTIAGTAYVMVRGDGAALASQGSALTTATIGTTGLRDSATTLPNVGFYGHNELVLNATQHLIVVLIGYTTATVYNVEMAGEEWTDAAYAQAFAH